MAAPDSAPNVGPAPNMPQSVMDAAKLPAKITDKYVLFFGYELPEPASTFQQWYPSHFTDPDSTDNAGNPLAFPTAEHYMMYFKAVLMDDDETATKILACKTPAEAKTFGRQVKNFNQKIWDDNCDYVVQRGSLLKFSQNKECKEALLGTGDRILVEASPNDRIWGIGFDCEHALGKEDEWGQNKLGKALMLAREQLGKQG